MDRVIKNIPIPFGGLILSSFILGNVVQEFSIKLHNFLGLFGTVLMILFLFKIIFFPGKTLKECNNSVSLSVSGTYSMAMILMSTYIAGLNKELGLFIWEQGVALHIMLIVLFSVRYLRNFQLENVYGSWFIVYVGIVVGSVTACVHNIQTMGRLLWYLGIGNFVLLLIFVIARYLKLGNKEEKFRPLVCICAAPASLCIVGYVKSFSVVKVPLLVGLIFVSYLLYVMSLFFCFCNIRKKFVPAIAAFTFPFVISANATKQLLTIWNNSFFKTVFYMQLVIAIALYVYVLARYLLDALKNFEDKASAREKDQLIFRQNKLLESNEI